MLWSLSFDDCYCLTSLPGARWQPPCHWGLYEHLSSPLTYWVYFRNHEYIDGLVQDCSNSIALAMELLQSCIKPSMYWHRKETLNTMVADALATQAEPGHQQWATIALPYPWQNIMVSAWDALMKAFYFDWILYQILFYAMLLIINWLRIKLKRTLVV